MMSDICYFQISILTHTGIHCVTILTKTECVEEVVDTPQMSWVGVELSSRGQER